MPASDLCKQKIKESESLALESYLCPAGYWTLGYGHTSGIAPGMKCTQAQADVWLDEDLTREEHALAKVIRRPLNQNELDALLSLTFNLKGGAMALPKIAPKLTLAINQGQNTDAAKQFLDINHGAGKVLGGLTKRRLWESQLFLAKR